jgi:putative flippase GtrA
LATLASAVVFAVAYRVLHFGPRVSSVSAFTAGAVVNFIGNRFWAWARRHQPLLRDIASYAVLALTTAAASAGVTTLTEIYANRLGVSDNQRALLVEGSYFATYAAVFLVKFVVLDRVVFGARPDRSRHQVESTTRA